MDATDRISEVKQEITLKELILIIWEYLLYLWSKKWWLLIAGLILAGLFAYQAYRTEALYLGEISYIINDDKGDAVSGSVGSILGQFGISGGGSDYNLDKVLAICNSKRIVQKTLVDSVEVMGVNNLIGNHIIEYYDYDKYWAEKDMDKWVGFRFTSSDRDAFGRREQTVLNQLQLHLKGSDDFDPLIRTSYDDNGILFITGSSLSEQLTLALINGIYDNLSVFYTTQAIGKQTKSFQRLSAKTDSVRRELLSAEYQLADYQDRSLGLVQRRDQLKLEQLTRKVELLTLMYGEVLKNKEASRFILDGNTPFFQVLDNAIPPLRRSTPDIPRKGLQGFFLGVVLCSFVLIGYYIFQQILKS